MLVHETLVPGPCLCAAFIVPYKINDAEAGSEVPLDHAESTEVFCCNGMGTFGKRRGQRSS